MVLWRISSYASLDGLGGLLASARWHSRGHRVVYLAATPPGALIEVLVHLELSLTRIPSPWRLMKIHVNSGASMERIALRRLPINWQEATSDTSRMGDEWLHRGSSALLEVPSAIVPETSNWLINPEHADAVHIMIAREAPFTLDRRLLRFDKRLQ